MTENNKIDIVLNGAIDFEKAQILVSKIRAAMRNKIKQITVRFSHDVRLRSAEFLSFLACAGPYLRRDQRELRIEAANGNVRQLLDMSKLSSFVMEESPPINQTRNSLELEGVSS